MMMMMMKISNTRQSNRCGGGTTKTMNYTITTTNERAGIRAYWGCILIDWNDATNLLWDEI